LNFPSSASLPSTVTFPIRLVRGRADKAIERDRWLTAEESKAFGLVDHIVKSRKQVETKEAESAQAAAKTELDGDGLLSKSTDP
jgi:enoyl-CoA hydratase/carnithine racemase